MLFLEPESFSDWAMQEISARFEVTSKPNEAQVVLVRVGCCVDSSLLNKMPQLKVVVSVTTGVDHIDNVECRRRNIDVLTLKGETEFLGSLPNTAEHAFALLLALYRRLVPASQDVLNGRWVQASYRGHTVQGKVLGIVGYGRLGRIAGKIANGFGMRVLAYDPSLSGTDDNIKLVGSLIDLAETSDILSIHADLNKNNRGMINNDVFHAMPTHAVLINTARGQLIDENALLRSLEGGSIAGAALDVIRDENEFGMENKLLRYARKHSNLLLTPHIAGQTYEAVAAADKYMVSKLKSWCTKNVC